MKPQAQHPALEKAPKSLREALERIKAHLETGKTCKYRYIDGDCRCPIGIFFTDDQLKEITAVDKHGETKNARDIWDLARTYGKENIEAMTGMTLKQANAIQREHDRISSDLPALIADLLSGKRSSLGHTEVIDFDLD